LVERQTNDDDNGNGPRESCPTALLRRETKHRALRREQEELIAQHTRTDGLVGLKRIAAAAFFALTFVGATVASADDAAIVAPVPKAPIEVPYPSAAAAHGDAEVILEVLIAEDGSVARVMKQSGAEPFGEHARRHVEALLFSPALRNGIPVRARIAVRIVFHEPPPPPTAVVAPPVEKPAPEQKKPDAVVVEGATEVHVLGEQRTELGSIHIPREEARRVPGAFGDPFRVVEVLPGVAPVLSGLPYFFVRGAPPGSVGYFIDGIRVPILFHVGPGPSVVTPLMIDRVDLYPGAYPSRFGRYSGAVFAGETTTPLQDRSRAEGQLRIFDMSGAIEQPFDNGRGSVLAGARQSFTQAVLAAVAPEYDLGYSDYQGRISYNVTPNDRVTILGFGGYDLLRNKDRNLTLFNVGFHRLDLRWDRALEGTGRMRVGATYSHDTIRTAPEDVGVTGTLQKRDGARIRAEVEQDLAKSARLRVGGDLFAEKVVGDREQGDAGDRTFPDRTDISTGVHADVIWRPARPVEIVPGMRFDQMRSRGKDHTFFEPRLGTRTRLTQRMTHIMGVGIAHQLPATATRMPGRPPSFIEQADQEAIQTSQGVEYALPSSMLGRTTLFYQHLGVDTPGVYGRSFGLEQFLRRDFTRRLGGFISYTLSRAEGQTGRMTVLSNYDRPHVLSAVLGYDFGGGYRVGARAYYASGRALTVGCPTPDCGPTGGVPGQPFIYRRDLRLPSFVRVDLRLEKKWTLGNKGGWITGTIEWFNATLSSEVEDAYYTPTRGIFYDRRSALTLPSIGVEAGW